jgi:hypothetical protein
VSTERFRHDPGERDSGRFRPRWWWFALFALNVAVHLHRGWDSSAAIGLPLGFAVTLALVFVPRLPRWLTRAGESMERKRLRPQEMASNGAPLVPSASPRGIAVTARVDGDTSQWNGQATVGPVRVTVTLPDGRPAYLTLPDCPGPLALAVVRTRKLWLHGKGLGSEGGEVTAEFGTSTTAGLLTTDPAGAVPVSRFLRWWDSLSGLAWRNRLRMSVAGLAMAALVAVPVGALVWAPWLWVLLIPMLVAAVAAAVWVSDVRYRLRGAGEGPLTPIDVRLADDHVWPAAEVRGWAVLGPGRPARLDIVGCPPEIAAELLAHGRVWVFGEPRPGPVWLGLPGRDVFAGAGFAQRQPASSTPPGTGADGS